jgi:hypothetical protein
MRPRFMTHALACDVTCYANVLCLYIGFHKHGSPATGGRAGSHGSPAMGVLTLRWLAFLTTGQFLTISSRQEHFGEFGPLALSRGVFLTPGY